MTAIKGKKEDKLLLDFSDQQYSKNKIRKALRSAEVTTIIEENELRSFIQYYIQVGIYKLWLWLPIEARGKLKDCGKVMFNISEGSTNISLLADGRFKSQYWVKSMYSNDGANINNLTDIITHCQRLNQLTVFL